jgi:alkylated DNA repair dioxygenase AlkB
VERPTLTRKLEKLRGPPGFTGNSPGGPSRWSTSRSAEWEPLRPKLVVEVRYDHVTNHRFRHGTKLMRWRPDKAQTMQLGSNFPIRETLDFQKCRRYCGSIDNIRQAHFTKYGAGVGIGWHGDKPHFDKVFGLSLASASKFRFRRKTKRETGTVRALALHNDRRVPSHLGA